MYIVLIASKSQPRVGLARDCAIKMRNVWGLRPTHFCHLYCTISAPQTSFRTPFLHIFV